MFLVIENLRQEIRQYRKTRLSQGLLVMGANHSIHSHLSTKSVTSMTDTACSKMHEMTQFILHFARSLHSHLISVTLETFLSD
jgi:hypothetical protein